MPNKPSEELDPMEEYIPLSQASREFKVKHSTLTVWVWAGKIPSRVEFSDLGQKYYMVKRGEVSKFLANRPKRGRPLNS